MSYVTCPKCGVERNADEAADCPICRMPAQIDPSEFGDSERLEELRKKNEKLREKQKARLESVETDYDSVQSLTETKIALSKNIGVLWKQIALLENHIESLKRVKFLIVKEIKKELTDL